MKNIETVWQFVETYFPDYSSSDEIARNNDLNRLIEEDESLIDELKQEINDSNAYIYEKAIEGYLETLKNK